MTTPPLNGALVTPAAELHVVGKALNASTALSAEPANRPDVIFPATRTTLPAPVVVNVNDDDLPLFQFTVPDPDVLPPVQPTAGPLPLALTLPPVAVVSVLFLHVPSVPLNV